MSSATGSVAAENAPAPVVATADGTLRGRLEGDLAVFRSIPYAEPPIGPLRWRSPQPVAAWKGERNAGDFGAACVQKVARQEPERSLKDRPQSEDCLTLNLWAPRGARDLPVMVWVHGGSFRFGSGSLPTYDGGELARRGVVLVTLNYRLGLFGTFAHPSLATQNGEATGNFGLLDVIAALRWVRTNVSSFGGNPDRVTLFGESAGGVSTAYLMASPMARGLFQQAIVQSGGLAVPAYAREEAQGVAKTVARTLGSEDAAELRALPADAIRDVELAAADTMPFIDGQVVLEASRDAFEAGRVAPVPLMIGSNDDEAGFFGPAYWRELPEQVGVQTWDRLRRSCLDIGTQGDDACARQVAGELFAGVNSRAFARGASKSAPVYAYRFAFVPEAERARGRGAIHTAEIPYVFGHAAIDPLADRQAAALSRKLADRWVSFAATGKPVADDPTWEPFRRETGEKVLLIGSGELRMGTNPAAGLLDEIDRARLGPRP